MLRFCLKYGFIFILLSMTSILAAKPTPQEISIKAYEKDFDFNWNNYANSQASIPKIDKIETFLKTIDNVASLNRPSRQLLGKLLSKLGAYYVHVAHQPDLAIHKLNLANIFLVNKKDKAWNYNHLAYAYQQRYIESGEANDKEKAIAFANKVISELYREKANKEVAFAYCIKGFIENDIKDYAEAEMSFTKAVKIYEAIAGARDHQYTKAKIKLTNILAEQAGKDHEAAAMLKQLSQYLSSKNNLAQDPYTAKAFISLGQTYLKMGNAKAARDEINHALTIYRNFYGANEALFAKPYQLLADAYQKLGDKEQASLYQQKASALYSG